MKISLTLPPHPDALGVLRATATAVGVRAGLTLDQLDDVRMGVEEAAVMLITAGLPMTMSADPAVEPFVVTLAVQQVTQVDHDPDSLSGMVLTGVTDGVDISHDDNATKIRLTFANPAPRL